MSVLAAVAKPDYLTMSPAVYGDLLLKRCKMDALAIKNEDRRAETCKEMAQQLKDALRLHYRAEESEFLTGSKQRVASLHIVQGTFRRDFHTKVRRAQKFYGLYEMVNLVLDPDDPVYSIINAGTALSTTGDNLTHQAASAGQGRIIEIIIGGEATTSAVNRVSIQRAGTSITANTAITPEKFNSRSPAAAGTYGKAGTQALSGNPMFSWAFNAFGAFIDWKPAPGEEIWYVNSEVVSMRSASGTSTVSSTSVFEEL